MENEKILKALRQVELMKQFGDPRPDTWFYHVDEPNLFFRKEEPEKKFTLEQIEEITNVLDLDALITLPDNGRDT